MITLVNLNIHYGETIALDSFTGTFLEGSINTLIGGDGAGKSSLLKVLASKYQRERAQITHLRNNDVAYQPAGSGVWRNLTVEENLGFIARSYKLNPIHAKNRINFLLETANLASARKRTAYHLSGGMRQKLGVIMAMLSEPKLLLLDEPTTGVDPQSRQDLWTLISQAAKEGATVVLATTYLDEAERSDRVFLLDDGKLLTSGTPTEVIASMPGYLWQKQMDSSFLSENSASNVWRRGLTMFEWTADATPPVGYQPAVPDLELATIGTLINRRSTTYQDRLNIALPNFISETTLIQAENITKYFGDFTALDHVEMSVKSGEIVGLIGGNGAGKSTLIRIILGLDQPNTGTITLFGSTPDRQSRSRIGYVPQSLGLYPTLSAQQNLDFTLAAFGAKPQKTTSSTPNMSIKQLSLGIQRNIAVECALSHTPELLILDEPTSGMDALSRALLWKTLSRAATHGIGVLITTHYQHEAQQCDRLIFLESGKRVEALSTFDQ